MEINKGDRNYHKCHDYTQIRRELDEIKINMDEIKINMDEMKRDVAELKANMAQMKTAQEKTNITNAENQNKVNDDLNGMKADLGEMKINLSKVKEELLKQFRATTDEVLRHLNVTQLSPHVKPAAEEDDIIIAGGQDSQRVMLSSVERFSWQTRLWAPWPPLREPRFEATSFVYNNHIFVAGGCTNGGATDSVDMINIHGKTLQWETFPAKIPIKVSSTQKTVVYQNRLIVVGGWDAADKRPSDAIYEVLLTPPYSTKLLQIMPETRQAHGVELINDKVFIMAGCTSNGVTDGVLMYDIVRNECKRMPSLPYAVWDMSTVSWKDKVILLGGLNKSLVCLNDVLMYDTVTGKTERLPSMKHERWRSSVVVTGDRIIIMGGKAGQDYLNSVECYHFSSNSWQELPPMTEKRCLATAVVKPVI